MINFEEELNKYQASVEVDNIEEVIQSNGIRDIIDVLTSIVKNTKKSKIIRSRYRDLRRMSEGNTRQSHKMSLL